MTLVHHRNVLIIGGGPVGLLLGLMLSKKNISTVVVEKRATFTRQQIIILSKKTYQLIPDAVKKVLFDDDESNGCFVLPPSQSQQDYACFKNIDSEKESNIVPFASIRIDLLQYELTQHVKTVYGKYPLEILIPSDSDISIETSIDKTHNIATMTSTNLLSNLQKSLELRFDVLVGADGANSFVRQHVMQVDRSFGVYEVINTPRKGRPTIIPRNYINAKTGKPYKRPIGLTPEEIQQFKKAEHHTVTAVIKLAPDVSQNFIKYGLTPTQIGKWGERHMYVNPQNRYRFFTSTTQNAYIALTLTPMEFNDFQLSKNVIVDKIKSLLYDVHNIKSDDIQIEDKDISFITIDLYRAEEFAQRLNSAGAVFLVGDAAFNIHYFTGNGLNLGVLTAQHLADIIPKYIENKTSLSILIYEYTRNITDVFLENAEKSSYAIWTDYECTRKICKNLAHNEIELLKKKFNIQLPAHVPKDQLCDILSHAIYTHSEDIVNNIDRFKTDIVFQKNIQNIQNIQNIDFKLFLAKIDPKGKMNVEMFIALFPWTKIYFIVNSNNFKFKKNYRNQYIPYESIAPTQGIDPGDVRRGIAAYKKCGFVQNQPLRWDIIVGCMLDVFKYSFDMLLIEKISKEDFLKRIDDDPWYISFGSTRNMSINCTKKMFRNMIQIIYKNIDLMQKIFIKRIPVFSVFQSKPTTIPKFYNAYWEWIATNQKIVS